MIRNSTLTRRRQRSADTMRIEAAKWHHVCCSQSAEKIDQNAGLRAHAKVAYKFNNATADSPAVSSSPASVLLIRIPFVFL